jgi:hypothetical protein
MLTQTKLEKLKSSEIDKIIKMRFGVGVQKGN